MLRSRFLVSIAALTLLISAVSEVSAQEGGKGGMSLGPSARPFGQPGNIFDDEIFTYDAQLWAPGEITSLDGRVDPNTGFYFAFDLSYLSVSRPEAVPGADPRLFSTGNDFHWGRTYRFGYMSEEDRGIGVDWLNLKGLSYVFGQNILVTQPEQLDLTFNIVEFNRTFRQGLSNGGFIEPYFGFRYTGINDDTIEDGVVVAGTSLRFIQRVSNSGIGGQVGTRYFKRRGRITIEGDASIGASYNNQRYFASDITTTGALITVNELTLNSNSFIPALDLALRTSYNITRDISFRIGVELQYLWEGVARADIRTAALNPFSTIGPGQFPTTITSDSMIAAGFSWGFDWRR